MAVSKLQILNTKSNINNHHQINHHINFSDNFRPKSHSFGQVSLPMKTDTTITRQSSTSAFYAPPWTAAGIIRRQPNYNLLPEIWREIQGCDDWEDLVEPLNPLLRSEIVRYGELVSVCYKAFDLDPTSPRHLNCKYGKRTMLSDAGLPNSGYEITKYLYATPDIAAVGDTARWVGYVAVASDAAAASQLGRRDILVSFRGTVTSPEWVANLMSSLTPARLDPTNPRPEVKVESGFLSLYTSDESSSKFGPESCREQVLSEVSRLLRKYDGEDISITLAGHSMGSSLASLSAYDIAELGLNKGKNPNDNDIPVTVFSFGGPRVGNLGFKKRCDELGVKVLRVVNVNDPITKMPGVLFNEGLRVHEFPWMSCSCYAHVGVELGLDFFDVQNPSCVHDLDTYINLLKCPKRKRVDQSVDRKRVNNGFNDNPIMIGGEIFSRAKDFILSAQENFNMLPWVSAAGNMVSLVQSQRT